MIVMQLVVASVVGASPDQRMALGGVMGSMLAFFVLEAWRLRTRAVTERWLFGSLVFTAVGIVVGIGLSGGAASPLLTVVVAPLVIAFAAFGRRAKTFLLLLGAGGAIVTLAIAGNADLLPWGPFAEPARAWMHVGAFAVTGVLAWTGVAGLADAHAEASAQLDAMRFEAVHEAWLRSRHLVEASAHMGHALKNPLAAIKALVQLEAQRADGAVGSRRLEVALGEIDRMEALLRDRLALAGVGPEGVRTRVDLRVLLGDVARVLAARAEASGVRIEVPGFGAELVADRARLREALFNLVDNALRASPRGTAVTCAYQRTARGHCLTVRDHGAAMRSDVAMALATGTSAYVTTRRDGTGLGVAIARATIAEHGGTLTFEPSTGDGTIARVELPDVA